MNDFSEKILKLVFESKGELRYGQIRAALRKEAELKGERVDDGALDVRLSRTLKRLQSDGSLGRDDRGHDKGVFYFIPASMREMVKYQIFAKNELPLKIRLMMKALGKSRRILIHGFPLIFLYSALLRLREGNVQQFGFFLEQGKEMNRLASDVYWEDLIDEYAPSPKLGKDEIDRSLDDMAGNYGRRNIVVERAIRNKLIGKDIHSVIEKVLRSPDWKTSNSHPHHNSQLPRRTSSCTSRPR